MEEFIKSLSSPSWWIGVVIVGIVINIASAYLKNPIDKVLIHTSSSWRIRRTESLEKRKALIELLKTDSELLILYAMSENRFRIRCIGFILIGFLAFYMSTSIIWQFSNIAAIVGLICCLIMTLAGLSDQASAMRVYSVIEEVNEKYKNINT